MLFKFTRLASRLWIALKGNCPGRLFAMVMVCLLLQAVPAVKADTIGYTSVGGFTGNTVRAICNPYTATATGRVSSMSWYGTASGELGMAIYSDVAGAPSALLASSYNRTLISTAKWYTVNIAYTITSGTTYWLCAWGDSGGITYYFANGSVSKVSDSMSPFAWPNPFTTNATGARIVSMYATYVTNDSINNATLRNSSL